MRSFCEQRQVGLFTRSQLVGGWHLFLCDWKALSVSLLTTSTMSWKIFNTVRDTTGKKLNVS